MFNSLTHSFFLLFHFFFWHYVCTSQLECANLMHEKAGKSDDVGNHDHSRNKRTVVAFPFLPNSGVKHLMRYPSAASHASAGAAAASSGSSFEDRAVNADMPFQSAEPESRLLQMTDQESIARASSKQVITHIASQFGVRGGGEEGEGMLTMGSEELATLDQLMDDSLSLQCLTTPGVLILVVVLTCIVLAITTMSVCLSIRVKELAQQLEIKQSRQLHESFSIKTSPFAFAVTSASPPASTASSSPVSCLFDQETILPVQTLSSRRRE